MTTPINTPYRAIFCDLLTDQTLDILPLQDVTIDDYIGKPGSLSGTIPIPSQAIATRAANCIKEGRTAVYLQRGGDLWWGGIVWTSTLDSTDRGVVTLGIQAATFDSYANRRIIREDIAYTGVEQLDLVRDLWTRMEGYPGGDIGVSFGNETSAQTRTISWNNGDETVYYDAIDQLAALDNGFEYHISVYRDPATGRRVRRLRLGSPRIVSGVSDLVLDMPGPILAYSFPGDATRGGTTAVARGAGNSDDAPDSRPPVSSEQVSDLIGEGCPRIDLTGDYDSVTDVGTLDSLAANLLAQAEGSVVIPAITIRLDDLVPPALLGRTVRIRITDVWYTTGFVARYRIIGAEVSPPQRGRPDTANLYLEAL